VISSKIIVLEPRATELRGRTELLHRGTESLGFVSKDSIRDNDHIGQRDSRGRSYRHSFMIRHTGLRGHPRGHVELQLMRYGSMSDDP
jgi:hypothetical protein